MCCGSEWTVLQWVINYKVCVCASESETFPIADKPKGSTPWSQSRRMDGDWWNKEKKVSKKESCDSSPQRHKKRRGLVIDCKKTNKGWKTNKGIHIKNQMWKERRTRTEGWGQLREVSHILMSLSLTLTHCPSASHHSYQIHHPGHTSSSAQPACSCFHMQYLSLEPYATDLTLPKAFSCATGFSSLNIKPSC